MLLSCTTWNMLQFSIGFYFLKAETRLAAKRAARAEAREIRMKEIERQQKEVRKYLEITIVKCVHVSNFFFSETLRNMKSRAKRHSMSWWGGLIIPYYHDLLVISFLFITKLKLIQYIQWNVIVVVGVQEIATML